MAISESTRNETWITRGIYDSSLTRLCRRSLNTSWRRRTHPGATGTELFRHGEKVAEFPLQPSFGEGLWSTLM
jgi:hypothetical protein